MEDKCTYASQDINPLCCWLLQALVSWMPDSQVMSVVLGAGERWRVNIPTICTPTPAAATAVQSTALLHPFSSSHPSSPRSSGDEKQVSGKWSCTKPTTASHYPLNSTRLITMTMTDGLLLDHWDGTQGRDRNMQGQNSGRTHVIVAVLKGQ